MLNFKNMSEDEKKTLLQHLEELRKALLVSLIAIIAGAVVAFYYSDFLLEFVQKPITSLGLKLVFIGVTEGFFIKLKLALLGGLVLAFPVVAWELWAFIMPALYPHEKRYVLILFPLVIILFVAGVTFAYFTILKLALAFLIYVAKGLEPMITVDKYVSFVLAFTIPFGLVFELPVVVFFLTRIGVITPAVLVRNRKYALLVIFILAAALTPGPDPVSQCLMALPVYLLYEVSILVSKMARPKTEMQEDLDPAENSAP